MKALSEHSRHDATVFISCGPESPWTSIVRTGTTSRARMHVRDEARCTFGAIPWTAAGSTAVLKVSFMGTLISHFWTFYLSQTPIIMVIVLAMVIGYGHSQLHQFEFTCILFLWQEIFSVVSAEPVIAKGGRPCAGMSVSYSPTSLSTMSTLSFSATSATSSWAVSQRIWDLSP